MDPSQDEAGMGELEFRTPELAAAVADARTADQTEDSLKAITHAFRLLTAPEVRGRKLYAPDLDRVLADLPRRLGLKDRPAAQTGNGNVVVIGTEFYDVGGHARVASDLMRLVGRENVTLILTDLYRDRLYRQGAGVKDVDLSCRATLILKSQSVLDRVIELYNMLSAIRPTRIFLLNHHLDVCAVTGAHPFRDVTEFIHHTDYEPGLGATMPFARHVDLTLGAHLRCKAAGLHPVFASISGPAAPAVEERPPPATDGALTLGTAGHFTKYLEAGAYAWTDWAVAALSRPDTRFVHIGPVNKTLIERLRSGLEQGGIDPSRYVFAGSVKSVRAELLARSAAVYVCSAPHGGGMANVEALSAGIPVIVPVDPDQAPLIRFMSPLPGWLEAHAPAELSALLDRCVGLKEELAQPALQRVMQDELTRFTRYIAGEALPESLP